MRERHPQETSIGTFHWRGSHSKWTCKDSALDGYLTIHIESNEIDFSQLEEIHRISKLRDNYFALAMQCAGSELTKHGANPATMVLSGIGLSDDLYHGGFVLVYDYPDNVWPGGQLSVVFQNQQPEYCHSDDH